MRFRYKGTGVVVESDHVLDSLLFEPVEDKKEEQERKPVKKTAPKTTRKTAPKK